MIFGQKNLPANLSDSRIAIDNTKLDRVGNDCTEKYFKFVGIRLDEKLSWEFQIDHIVRKMSSASFALNQVKNILPLNIRKTIYNSLIKPHLEYGFLSLGNAKSKQLTRIIKAQKKAVRLVANKHFRAHADPLFAKLQLLKIDDVMIMKVREFMYKYHYNLL